MKKRYLRFLETGFFIGIFLFLFLETGTTGTLIPISSATYNASISDYARAVTVDNNDNIIVTGFILNI